MKDFRDKVVVITGGATGIGFSFAKRFEEEGAHVLLAGLEEDRLREAAAGLRNARWRVCDVTDRAQVDALADFAWDEMGHVDVLVNNAGVSQEPTPVIDAAYAKYAPRYDGDDEYDVRTLMAKWIAASEDRA